MQRQNRVLNEGYHLLRFTANDLKVPGAAAAQVRQARSRLAKHLG